MNEKVYILDYDLISPLGVGKPEVLQGLLSNTLTGRKISNFEIDGLGYDFGAEISKDLSYLYREEDKKILAAIKHDRKLELIVACYYQMYDRLHYLFSQVDSKRAGVVLGVGVDVGPLEIIRPILDKYKNRPERIFVETINELNNQYGCINTIFNPLDISGVYLANKLKLGAFQKTTLSACSASTQAIAFGYDAIKNNEADMVLVGGTDSIINLVAYIAFSKLKVMASGTEERHLRCRPLDKNRTGILVGEAGGLMVLANQKIVDKLKINPKLEMLGYGNSLDGYNITNPDPEGTGMKQALRRVLESSCLTPSDVDYINLHGTGTRSNDMIEVESILEVWGEASEKLIVSSTKDRHGHAIAAAGIQEMAVLGISMENNLIPCNLNIENPVMDSGLIIPRGKNMDRRINIALSNNFAFGGINTVLAVKKIN